MAIKFDNIPLEAHVLPRHGCVRFYRTDNMPRERLRVTVPLDSSGFNSTLLSLIWLNNARKEVEAAWPEITRTPLHSCVVNFIKPLRDEFPYTQRQWDHLHHPQTIISIKREDEMAALDLLTQNGIQWNVQ